jgi:hypothetical protein
MTTWYQQGDVCIFPVDEIPTDAKPEPENILARGEATGHAHVALGQNVQVMRRRDELYLSAPTGAQIKHEEHNPFSVPQGLYKIRIVREYDHFNEEARPVLD